MSHGFRGYVGRIGNPVRPTFVVKDRTNSRDLGVGCGISTVEMALKYHILSGCARTSTVEQIAGLEAQHAALAVTAPQTDARGSVAARSDASGARTAIDRAKVLSQGNCERAGLGGAWVAMISYAISGRNWRKANALASPLSSVLNAGAQFRIL